jgi:hypothetical protein
MDDVVSSLRLEQAPDLGHVYQDGGEPVEGLARAIGHERWDDVARKYLRS